MLPTIERGSTPIGRRRGRAGWSNTKGRDVRPHRLGVARCRRYRGRGWLSVPQSPTRQVPLSSRTSSVETTSPPSRDPGGRRSEPWCRLVQGNPCVRPPRRSSSGSPRRSARNATARGTLELSESGRAVGPFWGPGSPCGRAHTRLTPRPSPTARRRRVPAPSGTRSACRRRCTPPHGRSRTGRMATRRSRAPDRSGRCAAPRP